MTKLGDRQTILKNILPLLPLRDVVVFPHMAVPLLVGRPKSVAAIEEGERSGRLMVVSTQKNMKTDEPNEFDIYQVGTLVEILQTLKLPDGSYKILVSGIERVRIKKFLPAECLKVQVEGMAPSFEDPVQLDALRRAVAFQFEEYVKLNPRLPQEILPTMSAIEEAGELADAAASHLAIKLQDKQAILEILSTSERLQRLGQILSAEIEILRVEKKIMEDMRKGIEKTQRDLYLQEQLRAIERELGGKDPANKEIEDLKGKIKAAGMSREAQEVANRELARLAKMTAYSPEATVVRNYIDWLVSMPWSVETTDNLNIAHAKQILEEDHFALEKPKERILEYLAVEKLAKGSRAQILCFVGPPGVGKTSLAKSIARALNRNFARVSLGGVRDEAEIRGHRRTYIGAMPGRIIQSMRKAKSNNPVFLLDEIDKMSMDFRGDPSSALLEVLDTEQNHAFNDHYLEVDFDLSDVIFITTSNNEFDIPLPLHDRMEIIRLSGYTEYEKLAIAKKFLIPKQLKAHGLKASHINFSDEALLRIIRRWTREAGVRELERKISEAMRKIARRLVEGEEFSRGAHLTQNNLHKFLGPAQFKEGLPEEANGVGVATGLCWTESGGDIMPIETSIMKGRGKLILTGKLGEVMRESAQAALSFIRTRTDKLKIESEFYRKYDIHIHIPEGAIAKDGPSAGITMAAALVSSLTNRPTRRDVAMTGEITLRGKVLPIGGLKSKLLAAHRAGMKTVIIPKENEKDLVEIPKKVRSKMDIKLASNMDEVLSIALT